MRASSYNWGPAALFAASILWLGGPGALVWNCVAPITFGEGWRNNHHFSMGSSRQGLRWWDVDTPAPRLQEAK